MGDLIKLSDRTMPWKQAFCADSENSTLLVYVNSHDRQVEIFQLDDQGKGIRTILSSDDASSLAKVLKPFLPDEKTR